MTPEVRPVEPADVDEVIALVREVLGEFGIAFGVDASTDTQLYGRFDAGSAPRSLLAHVL